MAAVKQSSQIMASGIIIENNAQVAIHAPTEILAEQLPVKSFNSHFKNVGIEVRLLIDKMKSE